jgi:hypothetical protein
MGRRYHEIKVATKASDSGGHGDDGHERQQGEEGLLRR